MRIGVNDYEHVELEGDAVGTRFTNDAHGAARRAAAPGSRSRGTVRSACSSANASSPRSARRRSCRPSTRRRSACSSSRSSSSTRGRCRSAAASSPSSTLRRTGSPRSTTRPTSVSLGAVRPFGDGYAFVATLASSERLPVAEELYSDGPHLATGVVQIGDAVSDAETRRSTSTSASAARRDALTWSVTAFHTRYDDFIYLADTGTIDADRWAADLRLHASATRISRASRPSCSCRCSPTEPNEIDLRVFADYVRGELASGESLPRLPPLRYGGRVRVSRRAVARRSRSHALRRSRRRRGVRGRRRRATCC